jgi:hypothetical protein
VFWVVVVVGGGMFMVLQNETAAVGCVRLMLALRCAARAMPRFCLLANVCIHACKMSYQDA